MFGVISASYTDKGGRRRLSLSTTNQVQIRQKHQEVEYVVNQSGTNTATNTDGAGGAGVHRGSLAAGDWVQLNGPFNLFQADSITFRVADVSRQPARPADGRLAAGGDRDPSGLDHRADPDDGEPGRRRAAPRDDLDEPDVPAAGRRPASTSCSSCSATVTGGQTGNNLFNLNWAEFVGNGVTVVKTDAPGSAGGSVPATLSLTLGTPATFGAFTPGVARDYLASTTANVISTAGDATLSVADPSPTNTGKLVNGTFALPQTLQANGKRPSGAAGAYAPVGGSASPTTLVTYDGPVSNESATIGFKQSIAANDALRTGAYGKTLTFTLSTTTP